MTRDVILAMVSDTFSDTVRRGFYATADQAILSLLASDEIGRVLVADHPRGLLSQVKRRVGGERPAPRSGRLRGVRPVVRATGTPLDWDAIMRRYFVYHAQTMVAARAHGLRSPIIISFNLFYAAFLGDRSTEAIFYAQDDEASIPRLAPWAGLTKRAYGAVDRSDTSVVAVSSVLLDRIAPEHGGSVIPNGIDSDLWASAGGSHRGNTDGRRAVYAGAIDERLDVAAFSALAQAGFEVELAGPVASAEIAASLEALPGVRLVGKLSRPDVAAWLAAADLCVLAHQATSLTSAMSPLKLFEYVASGTPVVATQLPGALDDPIVTNRAVLVSAGGDYVAAAHSALEAGRLTEARRQEIVKQLSWRVRHESLIDLITHDVERLT